MSTADAISITYTLVGLIIQQLYIWKWNKPNETLFTDVASIEREYDRVIRNNWISLAVYLCGLAVINAIIKLIS